MLKIYSSASKLVFIIMTLALVILTFKHIVDAKDFIVLASMAFTYYFTRAPEAKSDTTTTTQVSSTSENTIV